MSDTKPAWLREAERTFDSGLLIGRALGQTFRRANRTETDVTIPPALIITDSDVTIWRMGLDYNDRMEFRVLKNDQPTDEFASRIEYRGGVVTIYGHFGRKSLSRNRQTFI
jgi:hypothetical protein